MLEGHARLRAVERGQVCAYGPRSVRIGDLSLHLSCSVGLVGEPPPRRYHNKRDKLGTPPLPGFQADQAR